jgi:hypothetical protein
MKTNDTLMQDNEPLDLGRAAECLDGLPGAAGTPQGMLAACRWHW